MGSCLELDSICLINAGSAPLDSHDGGISEAFQILSRVSLRLCATLFRVALYPVGLATC